MSSIVPRLDDQRVGADVVDELVGGPQANGVTADQMHPLMAPGHAAGTGCAAAGLTGDEDTAELPTAGLYGVRFDGQSWSDIGWHSGVATLLEVPGRSQRE